MAFYQAGSGGWTPFKRVAFGQAIERNTIINVIAPYSGTYLIAIGLYAPLSQDNTIIRGAYISPFMSGNNQCYDSCSYAIKYVEKGQVIYNGEALQASNKFKPCYCIYFLTGKQLTSNNVDYLGNVSNSKYGYMNTGTSYMIWIPDADKDLWKYPVSVSGLNELSGNNIDSINITDKEYLISIIGGQGVNGGATDASVEPMSYASGVTTVKVPSTDTATNKNYIYYCYSDTQAAGLIVNFYKFSEPVNNFKVGLGVGRGMAHLLKLRL